MNSENKLKHLEFLQGVINRMANNSFFLKGWCVTLVSALFALAAKDSNHKFIFIAFFPVIMFWILDAYYLRQERLFREKYDEIRQLQVDQIDFSLNTATVSRNVDGWYRVALSQTLVIFYSTMLIAIVLAIVLIFQN